LSIESFVFRAIQAARVCVLAPVSTSIHVATPPIVPRRSGDGKCRPGKSHVNATRFSPGAIADFAVGAFAWTWGGAVLAIGAGDETRGAPPPHEAASAALASAIEGFVRPRP
jgi:hypothetical protein